jgi:hypothetical protein
MQSEIAGFIHTAFQTTKPVRGRNGIPDKVSQTRNSSMLRAGLCICYANTMEWTSRAQVPASTTVTKDRNEDHQTSLRGGHGKTLSSMRSFYPDIFRSVVYITRPVAFQVGIRFLDLAQPKAARGKRKGEYLNYHVPAVPFHAIALPSLAIPGVGTLPQLIGSTVLHLSGVV